jgi:hypothetical protein
MGGMWNLGYVFLQFFCNLVFAICQSKSNHFLNSGDCASFVWSADGYAIFHPAKWFFPL